MGPVQQEVGVLVLAAKMCNVEAVKTCGSKVPALNASPDHPWNEQNFKDFCEYVIFALIII